jgi:hypothetical protein
MMEWTTPAFVEVKMDAEVGSYQQDDPDPSPIVESSTEPSAPQD